MLTCYGDVVRLPQSALAYVGFRLAALDTLCQMEICRESGAEDVVGYLAEVPLREQVAPAVQVDLLADVWRRHGAAELHEASLRDAAVVYAAFCTAGRVLADELTLARRWLQSGPRRVRCRVSRRDSGRLHELFFAFWDDDDFLALGDLQDLPPEDARRVRELMGWPDDMIQEMEEGLTRWRPSPKILTNLEGLLTAAEVEGYARVLLHGRRR